MVGELLDEPLAALLVTTPQSGVDGVNERVVEQVPEFVAEGEAPPTVQDCVAVNAGNSFQLSQ